MKNDYEIRGEKTALFIKRKDGSILEALISTSDLERAKEFPNSWCAHFCNKRSFYVVGFLNGKRNIKLHRWILKAPDGVFVDHINHDTLNNTRENLRLATHAENRQNLRGPLASSNSGVRGVCWHKTKKKWIASVTLNNKRIHLGYFKNINDAEKAAIEGRKKYMPFSVEHEWKVK